MIPDAVSRSADVPIRRPEVATILSSGPVAGATPARLQAIVASLPLLWLAGSSLTSLLLAAGLAGTRALRRESLVLHEGEAHAMALRLADSLGMARRFGFGVCERIASPVLLGIVRPLILLPPAALSGWTVNELEMVLLARAAHLRRHDNLVNLWQCVVESLLFFHPVTWWLSGWVRLERERCCDRVVVKHTGKSRPYAEMLAALAGVSPGRVAVSALGQKPVAERIRSILNKEEKPMRLTWTEGTGLVGAALLAGAMAIRVYAGAEPSTREGPGERGETGSAPGPGSEGVRSSDRHARV